MAGISGAPIAGMRAFDQVFLDLMDTYSVPGLALAVSRDGNKVIERGYGLLDRDDPGSQVTAQNSFRIASMSKPITAMALIRLLGQQVFTLDTQVYTLLSPTFALLPGKTLATGVAQITIRQLLQHSAGWSDVSYDPMFDVKNIAQNVTGTWPPPANQAQIIQTMWSQPLVNAPGSQYAYANFHYCLLGRVIEHFAGSYAGYVGEMILQAFGMNNTFIATHLLGDRRSGEAKYFPSPGGSPVNSVFAPGKVDEPYGGFDIENMDSHGGWVSSPVDLLAFMKGVFRSGVIDPSIITAPGNTVPNPGVSGASYGLGWNVGPLSTGGLSYWHLGSLPGTASVMVRTQWPDGADVCWAAVMNISTGGLTGGAAAAGGVFVSVFGQQQHFAWRDGNGTIWDAWFDVADGWSLQQLNASLNPNPSAWTSAPPANSDPFVSVFGQQQHFVYWARDSAIWDVWFDAGTNGWSAQQINGGGTGMTNGPISVGNPFVSVFGSQQHFTYRTPDGTIADSWFDSGTGAWNVQQLNTGGSAQTFAPPAAGDPFVSVFGNQQHVVYRARDGALWDIWFDSGDNSWNTQVIAGGLSSVTPGPPPASDAFVSVFGQQLHIVYADAFGLLWDAWFDGGWKLQQLNGDGATDGPLAANVASGSAAFVNMFGHQQHFAYRDEAGRVWDLWFDTGQNRWAIQQLNIRGLTGGPAAAATPFTSLFGQQQHFAYPDVFGGLWDVWFDETQSTWHAQQLNGLDSNMLPGALDAAIWTAMSTIPDLGSLAVIP